VILAALRLAGYCRNAMSYRAVLRFTRRPEKLFSLIAGAQNWRPDVTRSEILPAEKGRELVRESRVMGKQLPMSC